MRLAFADPANIHQKALKEPVLALYLCRDLATGLRERRTVIGRVVDQPLFAQFLEHLGDARVPYAETRRNSRVVATCAFPSCLVYIASRYSSSEELNS